MYNSSKKPFSIKTIWARQDGISLRDIYIQACSVNHHHWIHGMARGAICVDFEWLCKATLLKLDQQAPLGHFRKQPSLWNLSHTENTLFSNRFNQQDKQQPYVYEKRKNKSDPAHMRLIWIWKAYRSIIGLSPHWLQPNDRAWMISSQPMESREINQIKRACV